MKEEVYLFRGIPELYANMKGEFFYKGAPARIVYNNGTRSVLCGKTKRGLIKLRTLAYKSAIEVAELPF
jgi:hypothetical protein